MTRRGRPKNSNASVHVAIAGWLHPEYDADIIAWLKNTPKGQRMNALKTALRSGGLSLATNTEINQSEDAVSDAADILSNWEF